MSSSLPTPIKVDVLQNYLSGYQRDERDFLIKGFREGFKLGHVGGCLPASAPNLLSAREHPTVVERKLAKELSFNRIAGPFKKPPFPNFRASPIGVVPKKTPGEFRLIHHLSYPKGFSVNDQIPKENSSVRYASVDSAIAAIKRLGPGCFLAKTDIQSAFRLMPIHPSDYPLLGFTFKEKFYYDKVLPMGASSSCKLFERFSSSLEWISRKKLNNCETLHILDDFLFITLGSNKCAKCLNDFIELCHALGVPIAFEKTEGPLTCLCFTGIELDTIAMEARLPPDKVQKCLDAVKNMLKKKKAQLREIQSLIGLLSFAVTVVVPGRPFLRRMIDLTKGIQYPFHQRRINKEVRADLKVWLEFIENFNGRSMFLDDVWQSSDVLNLYTDSSTTVGFGAVFGSHWAYGSWDSQFVGKNIAILEFYPIVLAVHLWGSKLRNKCVTFFTDNLSLVHVINKQTSKDAEIMTLLRRLVLVCLQNNILFRSTHVPGKLNNQCDALSRLQIPRFWHVSKGKAMDQFPTEISPDFHHANWLQ